MCASKLIAEYIKEVYVLYKWSIILLEKLIIATIDSYIYVSYVARFCI
mgnify:CR=1 FL=1